MTVLGTTAQARHEQLGDRLRAHKTRRICIVGLIISWMFGFVTFAIGVHFYPSRGRYGNPGYDLSGTVGEIVPLIVNMIVTLLNERMGYVHSTSLRCSLKREGRHGFNSSLRLFSSSKLSKSNSWYSNTTFLLCVILSYTSISFYFNAMNEDSTMSIVYLLILGSSILVQAGLATWSLIMTKISTWSSSPLDATFTCLDALNKHPLYRNQKRCMKSVHDRHTVSDPCIPKNKQGSMLTVHSDVKWALGFIWAIVPLGLCWFGIVLHLSSPSSLDQCPWNLLPSYEICGIYTAWTDGPSYQVCLVTILIVSALQAPLTVGLHCAERLCNLSQDERILRQATSSRGTNPHYNSISAALKSWETIDTIASIHWMFSLSVNSYMTPGLMMFTVQIFYCTICVLLLALFATYISLRQPYGPLPATYGNLQTIADLVDEWQGDSPMFWGHKVDGSNGEPNFAGMGSDPMRKIKMNELYG
ncbi:hypothetical protein EAF00_008804 [Botryotinia globosa]|nr:hypothetical protein EAF00_008804 [Botryotinia globosa]